MLIIDDLVNENIELKPLPKVKEGFIHKDYKTGAKFIYIRGEKIKHKCVRKKNRDKRCGLIAIKHYPKRYLKA